MPSYPLRIFVMAGEASGDQLGGMLLQALRQQTGRDLVLAGIGGESLKAAGLQHSLFPIRDLAVMGLAEILPKIPFFMRVIGELTEAAEKFKPDLVLSIDSPDLTLRVQSRLKKQGTLKTVQLHTVAPTVWAWREERAREVARYLDGMLCLLPFEPPYFERYGMPAVCIGHPAVDAPIAWADPSPLRDVLGVRSSDLVLGLYLGSRVGEIKRLSPVFIEALNLLATDYPDLVVLLPTLTHLVGKVQDAVQPLRLRSHIITDPSMRPVAMRCCNLALAASGTIGLELAIANIPHAIGYKMNPLTWWWIRRQVTVPYAHLANILLDQPVVPEFIQRDCDPGKIAEKLRDLLAHPAACARQQQAFASVRSMIGADDPQRPAEKAAAFIEKMLAEKNSA